MMERSSGEDQGLSKLFNGFKFSFAYWKHSKHLKQRIVECGGVLDDGSYSDLQKIYLYDEKTVIKKQEDGLCVSNKWASDSIRDKELQKVDKYIEAEIDSLINSHQKEETISKTNKKCDEESLNPNDLALESVRLLRQNWNSTLESSNKSQGQSSEKKNENNKLVISELNKLGEFYCTDFRGNVGTFRRKALNRAIKILKSPPYGFGKDSKQIASADEILSVKHGGPLMGGIGKSTAEKIAEILASPKHKLARVVGKYAFFFLSFD